MRNNDRHVRRAKQRRLLVRSLSAALGLASADLFAGTVYVTRCNDQDGIQYFGNSLRLAINIAVDGDTVDASGLSCSTITLERGELYIDKGLILRGPNDHTLTIDAHGASRVVHQYNDHSLEVDYLALANGGTSGNGGCISSDGTVLLEHSTLSGCLGGQYGGGLFAAQVRAKYSTISDSFAANGAGAFATSYARLEHSSITGGAAQIGGGISVNGALNAYDSMIAGNSAGFFGGGVYLAYHPGIEHQIVDSIVSGNTTNGKGGGIYASHAPYALDTNLVHLNRSTIAGNHASKGGGIFGNTDALQTTISGNTSDRDAAGIYGMSVRAEQTTISNNISANVKDGSGGLVGRSMHLVNATISGNSGGFAGGIALLYFTGGQRYLELHNSTVAFNRSTGPDSDASGGIFCVGFSTCEVVSSIVSNNVHSAAGPGADLYAQDGHTGGNNLIVSPNHGIGSADPKLTPLGIHGGLVATHAILATSPAFNTGTNPDALQNDARGSGFVRSVGGPDIGAYERQVNDDELYYSGFD